MLKTVPDVVNELAPFKKTTVDVKAEQSPEAQVDQLRGARISKLESLREAGVDPYPSGPFMKDSAADVVQCEVGRPVTVAGRIMRQRIMGSIAFFQLADSSGTIQIVLSKKDLKDSDSRGFDFWTRYVDLGDIIGVTGVRFDTNTGEKSVKAATVTMLSKALAPLPDKLKGLQDEETRLRKRYHG